MTQEVHNRQVYYAGSTIFREGEFGSRAFLIASGSVEISKHIAGENVVLGRIGPGDIFGEMALIDKQPRSATATVKETTVLVVVN
jgi:CRP-like cAMP-binding protein